MDLRAIITTIISPLHIKLLQQDQCIRDTNQTFVEINELSEAIISIHEVVAVTIEAVAADIFKIFTGTQEEHLLVLDADNILGTSHRNRLLPNHRIRHKQDHTRAHPSTMVELRMKRTEKTYSDPLRSCKLRIRKKSRRKTRSRCHPQAGHPQQARKVSKTPRSSALLSRDHRRQPRPHRSQRSPQS